MREITVTCEETRKLLNAYADRELDLLRNLDIEDHLKGCAGCSALCRNHQTLTEALQDETLYFRAPAGLNGRVHAALEKAAVTETGSRQRSSYGPKYWLPIAASLLIVVATLAFYAMRTRPSGQLIAQEVVTDHVRSLLADHLVDVPSSDQHTVKPWFTGKLDFAPPVKDLTGQGFILVGGRLDYLDRRNVAALVFRRRQHTINLFIWPAIQSDTPIEASTRQGFNIAHFTRSGLTYWAVSDLNASELHQFLELQRN